MSIRPFAAAVIVAIAAFTISSQTPNPESPTCNEEFARFLVEQQVDESRTVEQTDKRVSILIRAAEFLWKLDEPEARQHFTDAFKVANDRYHDKGFEKVEKKGLITMLPDYRFEVIRAISKKDPVWGRKLIDQVMKEFEKDAERKEFDKNREVNEILRIAREVVKTNPEFSRSLFRLAMKYPLDYYWFWLLYSVAEDDRRFADQLYVELIANYSSATPRRLLFLSAYPFASPRIFGIDRFGYGATVPDNMTPNRDLQRQYFEVFMRRVISFASDPQNLNLPGEGYRQPEPLYMLSALAHMEPIVVQQFPTLIQMLSEAKAQANGMLSDRMRKDLEDREKENEVSGYGFDRLLKQLEEAEANGKLTDEMILRLVISGDKSRTDEMFKQIEPWLDKIKDESARVETTNYFWFLRSDLAVKDRRMDDATRYAAKIPEIEHRAIINFKIAETQLKNINDAATVYSTLREVGRLAEQSENSVEKARVLIALSNQYIKVNPVFAMQELSDAIKIINRLENVDVMTTAVFRQIRTKKMSYYASIPLPGYNLEGTFKAISKDNFELSLTNAKTIEDKYLRTLAVLAIAQNCIETTKKKAAPKKAAAPSGN